MDQATHNKIVSFIWGIADDVLRDLFKRGKYPDVILPMCVIRRMDAVLEPTKQALSTRRMLDDAHHRAARRACRRPGYNASHPARSQAAATWPTSRTTWASRRTSDILENFKFRNQAAVALRSTH
jgi:type I restriction enzyme M protein